MNVIDFAIRTRAGAVSKGSVGGDGQGVLIDATNGNEVSLNLHQSDVARYERAGNDLVLTLSDGRELVLEGYFGAGTPAQLYLSADGILQEVTLSESAGESLAVQYGHTETLGKWSPSEDLIFFDRPALMVDNYEEEEVSMLGAGLLGSSLLGPIGAGAALLGGAAILGSGSGGSGGSGGGNASAPAVPTVDDADIPIIVGGTEDPRIDITGTGEPGSTVVVTIGAVEETTVIEDNGAWGVEFDGEDFPDDGSYEDVTVVVEDEDGTVTDLTGPPVTIDLTPPPLEITEGTAGTGDIVNAGDQADGVTVAGTSEPGATVEIALGEHVASSVADEAGGWQITFDSSVVAEGEYLADIVVTATDAFGNSTALGDALDIDTVAPPLSIDPVGGDDLVNGAEAAEGFAITGSAEAGAPVVVTYDGESYETVAGEDGRWAVMVSAADVVAGEYSAGIEASTLDRAGNVTTTASTFSVDTETSVAFSAAALTGDDLINAEELADGVLLTGSAEPGATVMVTVAGLSQEASVAADGRWSVTFNGLEAGSYETVATVSATDAAGNTASAEHAFAVDTEISVTLDDGIGGDGTVNAAEAAEGVVLTGSADAGASVHIEIDGTGYETVADAAGQWRLALSAADIASGSYDSAVTVTATDAAGNSSVVTGSFAVDTETSVAFAADPVEGDGIVNAVERADGVSLSGVAEPGAGVEVTLGTVTRAATVAADGGWTVDFAAADIPEGEAVLPVSAIATDAAGNTASASGEIAVDTLVRDFALTSELGGADGIISASEAAEGLTLTGSTEPGASVQVTLGGIARAATVAADGSWTVSYGADALPSGEQTVTLTAVSTDAAGNSETLTREIGIDTDAGLLTIDPAPLEGDDIVNAAEASDGVVVTGTSTPGQAVAVTLGDAAMTVTTDADGVWSAAFAAAEIPAGTYTADITATITDAAGNTLTRSDGVGIDTEVVNFGLSDDPIETDDVVNAAEAADGVTLTGTTEPGSSVTVTFEGTERAATVDAAGNWSASFTAAEIPAGQYDAVAEVSTTDAAGNTASASARFAVDTYVDGLAVSDTPIAGDDIVNAEEARSGFGLTGTVEPGSTVTLTVGGVEIAASVDTGGNWTADIPATAIPAEATELSMLIEAVDAAGNTTSITETVAMDTLAPDTPDVESYTRDHTGLRGITLASGEGDVEIDTVVDEDGAEIADVAFSSYQISGLGETAYSFNEVVPDGSHLVVSATDAAGNRSGTYLVVDDTTTSEVAMSNPLAQALSQFNIETIDLQFAEESALTITESQLAALSSNGDTLIVEGGSDDSVTIVGAQAQGNDGEGYNLFSLGDTDLRIDEDITNVVI
ncbi:Ig-like domain-containing protein [Salipiger abyssi]|uniref:Ig-like domain (Group 3) n=1 Tax=Salipiger abyssi TaxID=1250539 RepID=A0A1P8UV77_9RHOB|nr:Ig-like domain-containing protein [Salipiger abyssi]APZ53305.1 Ig-like domain (group 3) [Salipiger abyssi]